MKACPGLEAFGLDISRIRADEVRAGGDRPPASRQRHRAAVSRQQLQSRDLAQHHPQSRPRRLHHGAARRSQRVSPGRAFVQVDSYRTPEQKAVFEDWVLTAKFHDYPDGWIKLFERPATPATTTGRSSNEARPCRTATCSAPRSTPSTSRDGARRAARDTGGASSTCRSTSRRCTSAAAFSCTEIVDCIYNGLMRPGVATANRPTPSSCRRATAA